MTSSEAVRVAQLDAGSVWLIGLNRPGVRNAVDHRTGQELARALVAFDTVRTCLVCVR